MISSYFEDDYGPGELDEQLECGEAAYCEVNDHYDWSDNIHGYPMLRGQSDWTSCCYDCCGDHAKSIVQDALQGGLGATEIVARVGAHLDADNYSESLAEDVLAALRHELQAISADAEGDLATPMAVGAAVAA